MNKKIIYEIYRQQQLMGVDAKILKENKYVEIGSDLIKSFFNKSQKVIDNVVDDVLVGSVRVNKQVLKNIMDVLDDTSLYDALSKVEKEIFGRIVSQNQGIVDDIYELLMSEAMSSTNKSEKGLIEFISNQAKGNKKIGDVLTDLNGEEDVFLNEVLIQKIAQKIRDLKQDKFVTEVVSDLGDEGGEIVSILSKESLEDLSPKTLKWWENILSSDKTLIDFTRAALDNYVNKARLWKIGDEKFVQDLYNKLDEAIQESVNKLKRGEAIDGNLFRNIRTNMDVLIQKYETGQEAFYSTMEKFLKKRYPNNSTEVSEVLTQVKSHNPFESGRWGAITQFLDNTSTSRALKELSNSVMPDFMKKQIPVLLERTVSLLTVGAPKSIDEWASYFKRGVPGLNDLVRDLWVATHVGLPATILAFQTTFQWFNILGYGNDTDAKNIFELYWKNFVNRYNKWKETDHYLDVPLPFPDDWPITKIDLNPVHLLGLDVVDWMNSKFNIKEGEGILNKGKKEFIEALSLLSDEELSKLKCYDKTKSKEENINIIFNCMQEDIKKTTEESKKKTEEVIDDATEAGLKGLFNLKMKEYGFTVKKEYDGVSAQTNEIDSSTGFDTWYWDEVGKKFIPYTKGN
jgi:hypothetical protein